MTERVQPGTKVDATEWERFRNAVRERKGGVRGHLKSELETALRLYASEDVEVSAVQLNKRLSRIESELGVAGTDGGVDTFEADDHTHAPSEPTVDEKPSANAPTDKKVRYLAQEIGGQPKMIPRAKFRDVVKEEYGFRRDTAKRYVEQLIEYFDLVEDPRSDVDVLVSPDRHDEIMEQRRQELTEQAEAEL